MSKPKWRKCKQRSNNKEGENNIEAKIGKKRIITYENQNVNKEVVIRLLLYYCLTALHQSLASKLMVLLSCAKRNPTDIENIFREDCIRKYFITL